VQHWVTYPIVTHPANPELLSRDGILRFARAAEAAGFDGIGFTDHPAPSAKWLAGGGHDSLDPFAALGFVAAATDRLHLIPNIVVLPYRNPFHVAKAAATLDLVSGGRFVLSTAIGYLRSEYGALGVDFDRRNELFDESLDIIRRAWAGEEIVHEGSTFTARGQVQRPQPGRIPIWIGGNSQLSRRRVAAVGDGWNPFPAPAALAQTAKTPVLETVDDLAGMLDYLWRMVDEAGRDRTTIDVAFGTPSGGNPANPDFNADQHLAALDELAGLGVTWNGVGVPGDSLAHAIEVLDRYGEQVIRA
jgi:probable F420-dependent oxidoreductase